jgi:hypothetical protein
MEHTNWQLHDRPATLCDMLTEVPTRDKLIFNICVVLFNKHLMSNKHYHNNLSMHHD